MDPSNNHLPEEEQNPFRTPLSDKEKAQLRYLLRTLLTILAFVVVSGVVVGIVSQVIF